MALPPSANSESSPEQEQPLVLVTGANGYIASHIVHQCVEKQWKVRGTVRGANDIRKHAHLLNLPFHENLQLVELDMMGSPEEFEKVMEGVTYVIHAASPVVLGNVKNEEDVIGPAVQGTTNIMHSAYNAGVKNVVYISSLGAVSAIFDMGPKAGVTEVHLTAKDFVDASDDAVGTYSKSKVRAEKAGFDFIAQIKPEDRQMAFSSIIPPWVFGPSISPKQQLTLTPFYYLMQNKLLGIPHFEYYTVDVRDVAKACILCLTTPEANGQRFLLGERSVPLSEMADTARTRFRPMGYPMWGVPMPMMLTETVGLFIPNMKEAVKLMKCKVTIANEETTEILKFKYLTLEDSVVSSCDSAVAHGFCRRTKKYQPLWTVPTKDNFTPPEEVVPQELDFSESGKWSWNSVPTTTRRQSVSDNMAASVVQET